MELKFHEKIKMLRKMHNMTQESLAHELGMSVNSYAQLERGETKSVSNDRLEQILNLFQINFLDFLSLGESGKLCLMHYNQGDIHYNQGDDNNNHNEVTIISGTDTNSLIAHLKKEIKHKDELLAIKNDILIQKDNQIAVLENLVAVLQDKIIKS